MHAVGIETLKEKLAEYVRIAAGGETVLVMDGDPIVAELGPPRTGRAEQLCVDEQLADAVREGWIDAPTIRGWCLLACQTLRSRRFSKTWMSVARTASRRSLSGVDTVPSPQLPVLGRGCEGQSPQRSSPGRSHAEVRA
jgi:antitoxin (DNA-binding transcriptional repressor) of toxin-antitoxin stability system